MKYFSFPTPNGGTALLAQDAILAIAEDKGVLAMGGSVIMLRNNETVTGTPGRDAWAKAIEKAANDESSKAVFEVTP